MSNVLVKRLIVIYGEPESINPQTYLDEVARLTEKYSNGTLSDAADHLISTHRYKSWPTPAQCIQACQQMVEDQGSRQPTERKYRFPSKMGPYDPITVAQWERAAAWRNSLPDNHPLVRQGIEHAKAVKAMNRDQFIQMQIESANRDLHRRTLTERSRIMMGDKG